MTPNSTHNTWALSAGCQDHKRWIAVDGLTEMPDVWDGQAHRVGQEKRRCSKDLADSTATADWLRV